MLTANILLSLRLTVNFFFFLWLTDLLKMNCLKRLKVNDPILKHYGVEKDFHTERYSIY